MKCLVQERNVSFIQTILVLRYTYHVYINVLYHKLAIRRTLRKRTLVCHRQLTSFVWVWHLLSLMFARKTQLKHCNCNVLIRTWLSRFAWTSPKNCAPLGNRILLTPFSAFLLQATLGEFTVESFFPQSNAAFQTMRYLASYWDFFKQVKEQKIVCSVMSWPDLSQ